MTDNTQLVWALDAHRKGWHIFPCEPTEKLPALLYPGTDRPGRIHWPSMATNDVNQIVQWWTANPEYNIGVAMKQSGLMVVDCDVVKEDEWGDAPLTDGVDQFEDVCKKRGVSWEDTIDTLIVETPSKGMHLYYWWPNNVVGSQRRLAGERKVDIRVGTEKDGGYVVGPGSLTTKGWYHVINPAPIKRTPTWLVNTIVQPRPQRRRREPAENPFDAPHPFERAGIHRDLLSAPEGKRNDMLNWAVTKTVREQPSFTLEQVYEEFEQDALNIGLTLQEIRGTVESAYRGAHRQ